jgi:hypothetical protein
MHSARTPRSLLRCSLARAGVCTAKLIIGSLSSRQRQQHGESVGINRRSFCDLRQMSGRLVWGSSVEEYRRQPIDALSHERNSSPRRPLYNLEGSNWMIYNPGGHLVPLRSTRYSRQNTTFVYLSATVVSATITWYRLRVIGSAGAPWRAAGPRRCGC